MKCRTPAKRMQKINFPLGGCQVRAGSKEDGKYDMPIRVKDCGDLAARAGELGCRVPGGIAMLPANFLTARSADEFRYHEAVTSVREAWRAAGLIDVDLDLGSRQHATTSRAYTDEPVHLAAFFGSELLRDGTEQVTVALGMVAAVLIGRPGFASYEEVRFDAVVECPSRGGYACLEYRGDVHELVALARPVQEVWAGLRTTDG